MFWLPFPLAITLPVSCSSLEAVKSFLNEISPELAFQLEASSTIMFSSAVMLLLLVQLLQVAPTLMFLAWTTPLHFHALPL